MAGAGLIAIKRRVRSVVNTRKITKAMGLIATAKLRKARVALQSNKKYYSEYEDIITYITKDLERGNIYKSGNKSNTKVYIAFTSESGLCGGFNANVIQMLAGEVSKDRENTKVIMVGQKGRGYLKRLKIETLAEYVEIPDIPTIKDAGIVVDKILELYKAGEVGEVHMIYTEFHSTVKQVVETKRILPLAESTRTSNGYINYEGSADSVLENMLSSYLSSNVLHLMLNSKASEQGSRMSAMDGATKNADDLITNLNLKYNRIRQSAITQEISEIVGGAEAQK